MVSPFDANDIPVWFFGGISRNEAELRLKNKRPGMFLIRESNTSRGSYVLCVSENSKVSHYIINKRLDMYQIGDQEFKSLPDMIQFYKLHFLDTTTLIEPCPKGPIHPHPQESPSATFTPVNFSASNGELFVALYDFKGKDEEDLPFNKGDKLLVVSKDEDQWWTAVHTTTGARGAIPKPYVEKFIPSGPHQPAPSSEMTTSTDKEPKYAIATQQRMPSAYDPTQLKLEVGDKITIIKKHPSGQWEGKNETTGKTGSFPFTHVQVLTDADENNLS